MNKLIFFDVETTGLDPKKHGIHQLAGEIVIDGLLIERFEYRIRPFRKCKIDKEALRVSNTSKAELNDYMSESEVMQCLEEKLFAYVRHSYNHNFFFLAGWRVPEFDVKFLKAFFERNAELPFQRYFWDNPIDVKTLATQYLLDKRPEMESFSLAPVAKYLGVEVDESRLHTAAYDAYLSRNVYEIVKP